MPLLDDRGRLFGRFNLIDAAIVLFLVALIPLGYVSWLLFRTPMAKLTSVEPAVLVAHKDRQLIDIHGKNLRPFLHVSLNGTGADYLNNGTPELAHAILPPLPAGTYD